MLGEQKYKKVLQSDWWFTVCEGCGAVVLDTKQHDRFHGVTRSIVDESD